MSEAKRDEFTITTPVFRVNFPALAEKKVWSDDKEPKFQVRMNFPKEAPAWMEQLCPGNAAKLQALRDMCAKAAVAKWGDKKVPGVKKPIKNGDDDVSAREEEAGFFFANASSQFPIVCVDQKMNVLISPDQIRECFYSGCWARASIKVAAYDTEGGKGVGFYLQAVQKVKDGERLVGSFSADTAFGAIAGSDSQANSDDVPF